MLMVFRLACSTVAVRLCGEMDIIAVFETVVPGSNPGGGTQYFSSSILDSFDPSMRTLLKCEE